MTTYSGHDFWVTHPTPWRVAPLRRLGALGTGHTPSRSQEEYWQDCTVPWVTTEDLTSRVGTGLEPLLQTRQQISELGLANSAAVLHPPDTVMLSRTASVGHVVRIGRPMATTQAFATWTCGRELDPRYLLLVLNAMQPEFERIAYGSTHLTIYMPDIEQIRVPVPPMETQRAIADFLHTETARIDALIAKKRRMIELLWMKLDAERSRCLWGDRPAVVPLMYLTPPDRRIMYGIVLPGPDVDDGVPIVKGGDVAAGLARKLCRTTREIESGYRRSRLQQGDLVFAIRGGIGDVAMVPTEVAGANITQDVARVAPAGDVEPRWLLHVLKSPEVQRQAQMRTTGATIHGLNIWELKRLHVPDRDVEQRRFEAARLDRVERRIEAIAFRLRHQTRTLQERRQALITAVVTGDLEVPGVAA